MLGNNIALSHAVMPIEGQGMNVNSFGITYHSNVRLGSGSLEHGMLLGAAFPMGNRGKGRHGRWVRRQQARFKVATLFGKAKTSWKRAGQTLKCGGISTSRKVGRLRIDDGLVSGAVVERSQVAEERETEESKREGNRKRITILRKVRLQKRSKRRASLLRLARFDASQVRLTVGRATRDRGVDGGWPG